MYKYFTLFCLLAFPSVHVSAQQKGVNLTFDEAMQVMNEDNKSLKIADYEIEWSKEERRGMNSYWYPKVMLGGTYVHLFTTPEIRKPMSLITDPVKDFIQTIDPKEELITDLLTKIGGTELRLPLAPRNSAIVNALVTYPIFTGGKRIYAGKIGKELENVSQVAKQKISAEQQVMLVQTYFGVRLAQKVLELREETYKSFEKHYEDALKLEANGMLTKAERLMFEVNRNEAKRDLDVAAKDLDVAQSAFRNLVNIGADQYLMPTTPLFINEILPPLSSFKEQIVSGNYSISALNIQKNIQDQQIKIAKSAYLPNIEFVGTQTLWSHSVDKYLIPRTAIGVGFVWNIFDGFDREKNIRQAKIKKDIIDTQREKAIDDLGLAVDQLYTQAQTALDNVSALKSTIDMSKELVRVRQRAFSEGMATSTEVVDAELMLSKVRLASLLAFYQFDMSLINLLALTGTPESFSEYRRIGINESGVLN